MQKTKDTLVAKVIDLVGTTWGSAVAWCMTLAILCLIGWGSFTLIKKFSYAWFYEDMVVRTMRERLRPECFKDYVDGKGLSPGSGQE